MLDRTIAPYIKDAVDFDYTLPDIASQPCENGIPLYFLKAGTQAVIQIEWVFEAGIWNEPKPAIAQAMGALLKNGTELHAELAINEALEFFGASLKVATSNDYTTVALHCLTKYLDQVLPVVYEILTTPSFEERELNIYKQNALQVLQVRLMNGDFVANRFIEANLFGKSHPYGRYVEASDLESLERNDLVGYFRDFITYDNCKIFVAGLFEDKDIATIQSVFGGDKWNERAGTKTTLSFELQPSEEKNLRYVNNEDGVQAAIRMAALFVDKDHPDFLPMQILNTLYGGYFGSRLMSNIREEKGFTYGIYSYIAAYPKQTMIMITSEVGRNVAQPTLDEILMEMNRLKEEKVDEQELLLVKNYMLGGLLSDLDGPFSIMRFWKSYILNNQGKMEFNKRIETFKNVTVEELQALAIKYYIPENFYTVVVV